MRFIRILVHDYGWIHLGVGMAGNALFVIGSVMFLPDLGSVVLPGAGDPVEWQTVGVWLFIVGSAFMLIGKFGQLLVSLYGRRKKRQQARI